jgi:hypothetical protein
MAGPLLIKKAIGAAEGNAAGLATSMDFYIGVTNELDSLP